MQKSTYLMVCKEKISMESFIWQNSLFHLIQKSIKMKMQLDGVCVFFFFLINRPPRSQILLN